MKHLFLTWHVRSTKEGHSAAHLLLVEFFEPLVPLACRASMPELSTAAMWSVWRHACKQSFLFTSAAVELNCVGVLSKAVAFAAKSMLYVSVTSPCACTYCYHGRWHHQRQPMQ